MGRMRTVVRRVCIEEMDMHVTTYLGYFGSLPNTSCTCPAGTKVQKTKTPDDQGFPDVAGQEWTR